VSVVDMTGLSDVSKYVQGLTVNAEVIYPSKLSTNACIPDIIGQISHVRGFKLTLQSIPGALEVDAIIVLVAVVATIDLPEVVRGNANAESAPDKNNKLETDNIIRAILIKTPIFVLSRIINL
jgi:hypothetical protein